MTSFQAERENIRRERTREAIALAMQSRWKEAETVNRAILERFPDDTEAHNRLGKALIELGRYAAAQEAFERALALSPFNAIAKKNLSRLALLRDETPRSNVQRKVTPQLFIEESGKAGITYLRNFAPLSSLAKLAAGDPVTLRADGNKLKVTDTDGTYLGQVEPKLALRLTRLISRGNRYEANIISVAKGELAIIIREVYKHSSQASIVSFPSRGSGDYRPYIRSSLLKFDLDAPEEEEEPERGPKPYWGDEDEAADEEHDTELGEGTVIHRISEPIGEAEKELDEEEQI